MSIIPTASAGDAAFLRLEEVEKCFFRGQANEVQALRPLSMSCAKGEWITLIGSNGAGKTTLLRVIAGTLRPDRGRVWLEGRDVTNVRDYRRSRRIGRVDQDPMACTAPAMTVAENLAMAWQRHHRRGLRIGVSRSRRARFEDALRRTGMKVHLDTRVADLSGGQRQAVALVMATIGAPHLLILDEHVAQLDPAAVERVLGITEDIVHESGLTTVMVTHNMAHAVRYGDRLIMLHQGRIILDVTGTEKSEMKVEDLIEQFRRAGGDVLEDRTLLTPG